MLPDGVRHVVRARGCKVRNVIQGRFFDAETASWAVLCSTRGKSVILVFPDSGGEKVESISRMDDAIYQGSDGIYLRAIGIADRANIVGHYKAYGGPKPPPIRHDGIDDSFFEKASVIHYRYRGKWLQLTGAD